MKCKKYIPLLFLAFGTLFVGCKDEYVDPVISASVEINREPSNSEDKMPVVFAPSQSVGEYRYAIGSETDIDAFIAGTLSGIERVEGNEENRVVFTGLEQSTVYTIFAMGYDKSGKAGPVASIKVKTRTPAIPIAVNAQYVADVSAGFTITGSNNYFKYAFALGKAEDKEEFEAGRLEGMETREEMSEYTANYFNLEPSTDYVFYAVGYDRQSELPMGVIECPFRTAARGTVPAVSMEIEHIDIFAGRYVITPNSLCSKFVIMFSKKDEYSSEMFGALYEKGNIIDMLDRWSVSYPTLVKTGYTNPITTTFLTSELLMGELDPFNYPLEAYAVVFDNSPTPQPFAVQKFEFTSPSYDDNAGKSSAQLKITDISQTGGFYEFTPNEHTLGLVFETFDRVWYENFLQSSEYYDGWMENYLLESGKWNYCYDLMHSNYPERTAEPGRDYIVFYMTMNNNGPNGGFGELQRKHYSTLPKAEESEKE